MLFRLFAILLLFASSACASPFELDYYKGGGVVVRPASVPTATPTPTPTPTPGSIPSYTTNKTTWESNMTTHGATWCGDTTAGEDGVWYYDGIKVYYKIREYTADSATWTTCLDSVRSVYKNDVVDAAGTLAGRRAFAEGVDLAGDDSYILKTIDQVTYSNLFHNCSDPDSAHEELVASREVAYLTRNLLVAANNSVQSPHFIDDIDPTDQCTNLGNNHRITSADAKDFAKWHVTRFINDSTYVQSFMAGLSVSALIDYHEQVGDDAAVPALVKSMADWLWANSWESADRKFQYCHLRSDGSDCLDPSDNTYSADLNLLIAPMYAWLWKEGYGSTYRDRYDLIFDGAIDGATLNFRGKTFSQNYRESFQSNVWRETTP